MARLALVAVAAVCALAAGCGDETRDDGAGGDDVSLLSGRTLVVTGVTDGGKPHALVAGTQVRFTFDRDDKVGVSTGCNSMGGTYDLDGDRLVLSAMSMTEMGCPEPQMSQEAWLAELLGNPITVGSDPLTFTIGAVVLTLADREDVSPDLPLAGTHWSLDGMINGDAASSVPAGMDAWLELTEDGTVTLNTGCNQGGGTVTVDDATLTFGPLATTRKLCKFNNGGQEVEQTMLAVLDGETAYSITEATLTITKGEQGLTFRGG